MGRLHDYTVELYDAARAYRDLDESAARMAVDAAVARLVAVHMQDATEDERMRGDARLADVEAPLLAVLHQLERGEAAEGNLDDIAWCARTLRDAVNALNTDENNTVVLTTGITPISVEDLARVDDSDREAKLRVQADLGLDTLPDDAFMDLLDQTGTDDVITRSEPALRAFAQGVATALHAHLDSDKAVAQARAALASEALELIEMRDLIWGTYCVWNPQMEGDDLGDPAWCLKLQGGMYLDLMPLDWMVVMNDDGGVRWQGCVDLDHLAEGYPHGRPRNVDWGEWLRWFSNDGYAHLLPGCWGFLLRPKGRDERARRERRTYG